ncbi:hypothetical protein PC128_g13706 [Phytophthora cactorum]|nr:hypothetical protein PC128_g13706 [Phytophthora cactorum]
MQFEFLREKVLKEGHLGWVLGPSGTGKSTTAMAFALTVDRDEWVVTWIHVDNNLSWRYVRLIGDERKTRIIDITELEEVLQFDDDSKHHLVLVDGWTAAESFTKLTITCAEWFLQKDVVMQRRLAFICSVAARGKVREDMEIVTRAMECQVWSWTLDEYLDATSDDTFFNDMLPYLDDSASDRSAMVETKYFYAGGSCRYMFYYNTTDVVEKLSSAVDSLNDAATTATNGPRSLSSINRLFAMFKRPFGAGAVAPVISRYAATTIAVKSGPDAIKKFMSTLRDNSNPALNGWMLEIFFFSSIRNGGLEIVDAAGNQIDKWDQSPVVVSDRIPVLSHDYPVWIKPENWKQGGYDAIMVCKQNRLVRMVQVTSAHTHTFRIEYFYLWLEMLSKSDESFEIGTLEIIFVVEIEKLNGFKISTVTGQGQLKPFGWDKGTEAGRVQRVGVRGLYNLST